MLKKMRYIFLNLNKYFQILFFNMQLICLFLPKVGFACIRLKFLLMISDQKCGCPVNADWPTKNISSSSFCRGVSSNLECCPGAVHACSEISKIMLNISEMKDSLDYKIILKK